MSDRRIGRALNRADSAEPSPARRRNSKPNVSAQRAKSQLSNEVETRALAKAKAVPKRQALKPAVPKQVKATTAKAAVARVSKDALSDPSLNLPGNPETGGSSNEPLSLTGGSSNEPLFPEDQVTRVTQIDPPIVATFEDESSHAGYSELANAYSVELGHSVQSPAHVEVENDRLKAMLREQSILGASSSRVVGSVVQVSAPPTLGNDSLVAPTRDEGYSRGLSDPAIGDGKSALAEPPTREGFQTPLSTLAEGVASPPVGITGSKFPRSTPEGGVASPPEGTAGSQIGSGSSPDSFEKVEDVSTLSRRIAERDVEIERLSLQLTALERMHEIASAQVTAQRDEVQRAETRAQQADQDVATARESGVQAEASAAYYEHTATFTQTQLLERGEAFNLATAELKERNTRINSLKFEARSAQSKLAQAEARAGELEIDNADFAEDVRRRERQSTKVELERNRLRDELVASQQRVQRFLDEPNSVPVADLEHSITELRQRNEVQEAKLQGLSREYDYARDLAHNTLGRYEQEIAEETSTAKALRFAAEEHEESLASLREEMRSRNHTLSEEVNAERDQQMADFEDVKASLDEYMTIAHQGHNRIADINLQVHELEESVAAFNREGIKAEQRLERVESELSESTAAGRDHEATASRFARMFTDLSERHNARGQDSASELAITQLRAELADTHSKMSEVTNSTNAEVNRRVQERLAAYEAFAAENVVNAMTPVPNPVGALFTSEEEEEDGEWDEDDYDDADPYADYDYDAIASGHPVPVQTYPLQTYGAGELLPVPPLPGLEPPGVSLPAISPGMVNPDAEAKPAAPPKEAPPGYQPPPPGGPAPPAGGQAPPHPDTSTRDLYMELVASQERMARANTEAMIEAVKASNQAHVETAQVHSRARLEEAEAARASKRTQWPKEYKAPAFDRVPVFSDPKKGSMTAIYYFRKLWWPKLADTIRQSFPLFGEEWIDRTSAKNEQRWKKYHLANNEFHNDLVSTRDTKHAEISKLAGEYLADLSIAQDKKVATTHLPRDTFYPSFAMVEPADELAIVSEIDGDSPEQTIDDLLDIEDLHVVKDIPEDVLQRRIVEWAVRASLFKHIFESGYDSDLPHLKSLFRMENTLRAHGTSADMLFHIMACLCPGGHETSLKWPKQLDSLEQLPGETTLEFFNRWDTCLSWINEFGYTKNSVTHSVSTIKTVMKLPVANLPADKRTLWDDHKLPRLNTDLWVDSTDEAWDKVINLVKIAREFVTTYTCNTVRPKANPKDPNPPKIKAKANLGDGNPAAKTGQGGGKGGKGGGKDPPLTKSSPGKGKGKDSKPKGKAKGKGGGKGGGKGKPPDGTAQQFQLARWLPSTAPAPTLEGPRKLRPPIEGTSVEGGKRQVDLLEGLSLCFGWHGTGKDGASGQKKGCKFGAACAYRHSQPDQGSCVVCNTAGHKKADCEYCGGGKFKGPDYPPAGMKFEHVISQTGWEGWDAETAASETEASKAKSEADAAALVAAAKSPAPKTKATAKQKAKEADAKAKHTTRAMLTMDDAALHQILAQRAAFGWTGVRYDPNGIGAGMSLPPTVQALVQPGTQPAPPPQSVPHGYAASGNPAQTLTMDDVRSQSSQMTTHYQVPSTVPVLAHVAQPKPTLKGSVNSVYKLLRKPGGNVARAMRADVKSEIVDHIPEGAVCNDSAATDFFRNPKSGEDVSQYPTMQMSGANGQVSQVPVDPHRDLIVEGEQLLPALRAAQLGVSSSIYVQGYPRPWIDDLAPEDAKFIADYLDSKGYRKGMVKHFLSYVTEEYADSVRQKLHRAEGRLAAANAADGGTFATCFPDSSGK